MSGTIFESTFELFSLEYLFFFPPRKSAVDVHEKKEKEEKSMRLY